MGTLLTDEVEYIPIGSLPKIPVLCDCGREAIQHPDGAFCPVCDRCECGATPAEQHPEGCGQVMERDENWSGS